MVQLFIGGVRSGKSDAAEKLLLELLKEKQCIKPVYIATSVAIGEETQSRIKRHQQQRQARFSQPLFSGDLMVNQSEPNKFLTYELDYQQADLLSILSKINTPQHVVLIECLSTWLGWYLSADNALQKNLAIFEQKKVDLLSFLAQAKCNVIIVTGEVGCGLIGETQLQRRYADALGELNQQVAKLSQHVYLVTAGIQQQIK